MESAPPADEELNQRYGNIQIVAIQAFVDIELQELDFLGSIKTHSCFILKKYSTMGITVHDVTPQKAIYTKMCGAMAKSPASLILKE
ncbi:hypothetical protein BTVI_00818 [Pitangus sulphuratus]|nr:hypothetical protein BTVI_00818 [Pitangus sulphuratus]